MCIRDRSISLEAGLALDGAGREIVAERPAVVRLEQLDGFSRLSEEKNRDFVYLCIEYDEKETMPSHSIASGPETRDGGTEFDKCREGYRLYLTDRPLEDTSDTLDAMFHKRTILYEDEHILLVDKRPGLVVHPDEHERVNTLLTHIQAYLYQKKEWSPYKENSFAPALCNRIDRNTGGIVIAAKTAEGLRVMNQKIRDRELKKYYLCIVHGTLPRPAGRLEGYILKDEAKKQVTVSSRPRPGAKTAVTLYETLAVRNGLSLVRCQLITGRTHQIRVQFASRRHPLWGDGKYGSRIKGDIALQSARLRFVHPDTGKEMDFRLPVPGTWPAWGIRQENDNGTTV